MLKMRLPAGVAMRPAVSKEAITPKEEERRMSEERRRMEEEYLRRSEEEIRRRWNERQVIQQAFQQAQAQRENQFKLLLDEMGEDLISQCNSLIDDVWKRDCPVWRYGADKGEPRPMPFMRLINGVLHLYSKEGASAKKIKTPISFISLSYSPGLEPYWKHSAWADSVVTALESLFKTLSEKLISRAEDTSGKMSGDLEQTDPN